MERAVLWLLVGVVSTLLCLWSVRRARRWIHRRRYGLRIAHEELLVQFGRQMASLLDREALGRLLTVDMAGALDATEAKILFPDGHDLVAAPGRDLRIPIHHAAARWVASSGEAMPMTGRLQQLVAQGRTDLSWTAVWVPLMRGTDLYGVCLLGVRGSGHAYSREDLRWLTTLARQAAVVLETIQYAEEEKRIANEMQALYRQAVSARESEWERLSRELHDGVLQDLCAVSRDLKALEMAAEGSETADLTRLGVLVERSHESVQTLRAICHDLRPPLLSQDPISALRAMVERMDKHSPAPIRLEASCDSLCLPEETALAIYRIAQESLHNAIQHADASEIAVRLVRYPDRLRMTITDDGKGIPHGTDLHRFVVEGHFGLAGMRERAEMIGGSLDVQSAPDYGTVVILEVPG